MAFIHFSLFLLALGQAKGRGLKPGPPGLGQAGHGGLQWTALRAASEEHVAFKRESNLWAGREELDIDDYMDDFELDDIYEDHGRLESSSRASGRSIHILGLQDSGTNLLLSNLLLNFGPQLRIFDSKYQHDATGRYGHGIWKHANICEKFSTSQGQFETMRQENVVALMMVREPLSWLVSLRKAPYELKHCVEGKDWLSRPCQHPIPAGYKSAVPAETYTNLMSIWTEWMLAYESWAECGFADGLIIRYEELVKQPQVVLSRIAERLGIQAPGHVRIMYQSAKTHGMSVGRAEALKKIEGKEYMSEFNNTQRMDVCGNLNVTLLDRYNYTDCDGLSGLGWVMWHGGDLPTKALVQEFIAKGRGEKRAPAIQVFGLQKSGTSLLMALLMRNFGRRVAYMDSAFPALGDHTATFAPGLWRHGALSRNVTKFRSVALETARRPKAIALAVVRDPLTWAEAMRMMDFEQGNTSCFGSCIWGDDWLERPCQNTCPAGAFGPTYSNLMGVWDAWSRSYRDARAVQGFDEVVLIHYEDLVLHPERVLQRVSEHIGMPHRAPSRLFSNKNMWQSRVRYQHAGRDHAISRLKHGRGLGLFTKEKQRRALCNSLSKELMASLGYKDCALFNKQKLGHGRRTLGSKRSMV